MANFIQIYIISLIALPLTNLFLLVDCIRHTQEELELIFSERTHSDWKNVWHNEAHSRCRDKLVRHLNWACKNDIYRLTRRNEDKSTSETLTKRAQKKSYPLSDIWLGENYATTLLRTRTRRSDFISITGECCTKAGCTWEEYAEYCTSNKRRNHY